MGTIMEITVDITRDDFYHFHKSAMRIIKEYKFGDENDPNRFISILKWTVYWLCYIIIIFISFQLLDIKPIPVSIFLLLVLVFFKIFSKKRIKNSVFNDGATLGYHRFIIEKDGIREETKYAQSFTNWEGIRFIEEDKHNVYLYVDKCMAHIIPKRFCSQLLKKRNLLIRYR